MRTAFPVINNRTAFKAGLNRIQSGDILSVKIIKNSNGLIKASVNGKIFNLRGGADLKSGQILKVRAAWSAETLMLERIDSESSIKSLLTQTGLKTDAAALLLFETAKRAGLPLKGSYLNELKRFLRKNRKFNSEEARTAVESIKKGLSAENIIHAITSRDFSDREDREKTILFNSLKKDDELWFVVPYNFKLQHDETGVCGSLRIKKNLSTGKIETGIDRLFCCHKI